MKGRKPKPTALKLVTGNPGKRALAKGEPKPEALRNLEPPEYLSDEAKDHWRQTAPLLAAARVLTPLDRDALAMYCESVARWIWANKKIRTAGVLVKTPNGYPTQSPLVQISSKAFEQMRQMLVEFGMSPSSRTRVTATQGGGEEPDEWDEL